MNEPIREIWEWIKQDWQDNRLRFCVELICWLDSMLCAIIVNSTVPNLPFHILYPLWISGTALYAWAAWSRGSFGMLITFLMIGSMDCIGFAKVLLK